MHVAVFHIPWVVFMLTVIVWRNILEHCQKSVSNRMLSNICNQNYKSSGWPYIWIATPSSLFILPNFVRRNMCVIPSIEIHLKKKRRKFGGRNILRGIWLLIKLHLMQRFTLGPSILLYPVHITVVHCRMISSLHVIYYSPLIHLHTNWNFFHWLCALEIIGSHYKNALFQMNICLVLEILLIYSKNLSHINIFCC